MSIRRNACESGEGGDKAHCLTSFTELGEFLFDRRRILVPLKRRFVGVDRCRHIVNGNIVIAKPLVRSGCIRTAMNRPFEIALRPVQIPALQGGLTSRGHK